MHKILDELVVISPQPTRPKCLLIFYSDDDSDYWLKKILDYAWSLKFLDFSILRVNSSNQIIFFNYNPFTTAYDTDYLETATNVFPNKLKDLNGYPLTLPAINATPIMITRKKSNGELTFEGTQYVYLKTAIEKHNFTLKFVDESENNHTEFFIKNFERLRNNEINMLSIAAYVGDQNLENIVIGRAFENFKIAITVPTTLISRVYFPADMIIYILCFPAIVLTFFLLAHVFDFQRERWEIFYIFQILMGISVQQPRRVIERIIYLTLVILSINYSSDLFASIADIKLIHEEKQFDTVDDILKSSMQAHTIFFAESYEDEEIKQLFSKIMKINTNDECI